MEKYDKNKQKFNEAKSLKEEQMTNGDLNLFDNKTKPTETTPAVEQPKGDEDPQLENMPEDNSLDLNAGSGPLPDTLIEVDIDGEIYEAKMNKGDEQVTLTLKNKDESAADKLNLDVPGAEEINNQNTNPMNMENNNMNERTAKDPFKNRSIIYEGVNDKDSEFENLNIEGDDTNADEIQLPEDDVTPEIDPETEITNTPEITELPMDDAVEQTAAQKIGEVIEDVIDTKIAEQMPTDSTDDIAITADDDDENWDDFDFDDENFDTELPNDTEIEPESGESIEHEESETPAEESEEHKEVLTDGDATDQEEPGMNNISKAYQEKVNKQMQALVAKNKLLEAQNKKMENTLSEIQLFTEKVNAMSEIDKLTNLSEQDKIVMKNLVQECVNSFEIKTVLRTIGTLKESMSKRFNSRKSSEDILKEHNISPKLRDVISTIDKNNPEMIKEQADRAWLLDMAGL